MNRTMVILLVAVALLSGFASGLAVGVVIGHRTGTVKVDWGIGPDLTPEEAERRIEKIKRDTDRQIEEDRKALEKMIKGLQKEK